MCNPSLKEKDGISALVVFSEMAAIAHHSGSSVFNELMKLYQQYVTQRIHMIDDVSQDSNGFLIGGLFTTTFRYGYFISDNSYFICHSPSLTKSIFDHLRYGSSVKEDEIETRLKRQILNLELNGQVNLHDKIKRYFLLQFSYFTYGNISISSQSRFITQPIVVLLKSILFAISPLDLIVMRKIFSQNCPVAPLVKSSPLYWITAPMLHSVLAVPSLKLNITLNILVISIIKSSVGILYIN